SISKAPRDWLPSSRSSLADRSTLPLPQLLRSLLALAFLRFCRNDFEFNENFRVNQFGNHRKHACWTNLTQVTASNLNIGRFILRVNQILVDLHDISYPHASRFHDGQNILPGLVGLLLNCLWHGPIRIDAGRSRRIQPASIAWDLHPITVAIIAATNLCCHPYIVDCVHSSPPWLSLSRFFAQVGTELFDDLTILVVQVMDLSHEILLF